MPLRTIVCQKKYLGEGVATLDDRREQLPSTPDLLLGRPLRNLPPILSTGLRAEGAVDQDAPDAAGLAGRMPAVLRSPLQLLLSAVKEPLWMFVPAKNSV